mgnify:CR=1 FL=1
MELNVVYERQIWLDQSWNISESIILTTWDKKSFLSSLRQNTSLSIQSTD